MKMLMVQIFWWILFSQFIGKFAKTFAPMFGVVLSTSILFLHFELESL